ncbi:ParB N-terminal domain-containing protein [Verrucosispora sp. WMMC514]|uniref:ParB/RepB/Spo0J family partition protein n=1 Tax=Verrucosispora sp. WMMC514 TaxID=3015156 RepID=UPI00248CC735|nr:ParB N-terminal domain-containing protein [Verrucosispora sp. WMMC514]WBB94204.1 ParB N-terminal domain-containing protein [Verrucosispora sp. WMMC514]
MEYVETRNVGLDELTPFPGNARRGDVTAIRESIRKTGQYRSIVVRDTGGAFVVLAGNHTMQAVAAEGHDTIRCEIIRCDDTEARRINLADNRYNELGTTDRDALAELLSYLDDDYEGTGYTDTDVERLITPPDLTGDDAAPPGEFPSYDDETISTEHQCPRCGYQWAGKSGPASSADDS